MAKTKKERRPKNQMTVTKQAQTKNEVNEMGLPYYLQAMNAATPEALMLKIIFQMIRALAYKFDPGSAEAEILRTHSAIFDLAAAQEKNK